MQFDIHTPALFCMAIALLPRSELRASWGSAFERRGWESLMRAFETLSPSFALKASCGTAHDSGGGPSLRVYRP